MKERVRREDFPQKPSEEETRNALQKIKEKSFYSSVLVNTFLTEVDPKSIVMGWDEPYSRPHYAVGGRMKEHQNGYMRITGNALLSGVSLIISWRNESDEDSDREDLFENHHNRIYIQSSDNSQGGFERFGEKREVLIQSDLKISFATERWPLAPSAIASDFDKWLITNFLPRLIREQVEPAANVPHEEMSSWVEVKEDPLEI